MARQPLASGNANATAESTIYAGDAPTGPELVIQDAGQALRVALTSAPITIGREQSSGVRLSSPYVSALHARVEPDGDGHRIVDLGSTNGILWHGRRLTARGVATLSDGDVLRIGDPATGSFVSIVYRNPRAAKRDGSATVVRRFPLPPDRASISIGREGSDIVLDNPVVSRRHAAIERAGRGHRLVDLASANGTFVNGEKIGRVDLAVGAVVQIGPFKLAYDGQSLAEYDQRGALRIDGIRLSKRVGGGKTILHDASISIAPRELVALVGGSGAGKSTLMKALAGYAPPSEGRVLVSGDDFYDHLDAYRALLGYVPQDDTLHKELTVERALAYAARLRLPPDTSRAEIRQRIARALEDVEMIPHLEKRIDQLSGGQRKRVSIAAELLADPSLFFLDEPTSGLDPGLEKKMMFTLRRLADAGRTVVLVTHATANITQCDHVAFLAEGLIVFFGPPREALAFFGVTTGDFADIYSKLDGVVAPNDPAAMAVAETELVQELAAFRAAGNRHPPTLAGLWSMRFRASGAYARWVRARLAEVPAAPKGKSIARRPRRSSASWLRQLWVLSFRYARLVLQDRKNLAILLLQAPIIGYLMTLVARSDSIVGRGANSFDAKTVLFMLSTVAVWFGIINGAREIAKEGPVLRRERLAGLRVVPYVLSKIIVLSFLIAIQSAALLALVCNDVRFPNNGPLAPAMTELFVTTALTSLAGLSLGLTISVAAKTPDRAISFVPLALIPQILFSGVLFPFDAGDSPTRVLSWFTVSRWAVDAYGVTINLNRIPPVSRAAAAEFTFKADTLIEKWQILGGYTAGCLILACILLALRNDEAG